MKRKAFTLVELLVVIAIIAMLLAILMPALNRVKQLAYRVVCGSHLRGIGQGIVVYASDFEDEYPIAGENESVIWDTPDNVSFDWRIEGPNDYATISASLYLLVKYAEVPPAEFVCKGGEQSAFELGKYLTGADDDPETIRDCFDFGPASDTYNYVSYAYHLPYVDPNDETTRLAVSPMSPVTSALMADRNPWIDMRNTGRSTRWTEFDPNSKVGLQKGNSFNHAQEGQNVLFNDTHVVFEQGSNCAATNDNIYTTWGSNTSYPVPTRDREIGQAIPDITSADDGFPNSEEDSFLVNDEDSAVWGL